MLKARVLPRTCEHELCCSRVDARARRRDTVKGRVRTQQNQTLCPYTIGEFILRPSGLRPRAWPWAMPSAHAMGMPQIVAQIADAVKSASNYNLSSLFPRRGRPLSAPTLKLARRQSTKA